MKKARPTSKIEDQVCPTGYHCKLKAGLPSIKKLFSDPVPDRLKERVSYAHGKLPLAEPVDTPRLFIHGLGGSIKLDLRGLGVAFSAAAFAHFVADESLISLDIHRGDIALVDPLRPMLRSGNLLLFDLALLALSKSAL